MKARALASVTTGSTSLLTAGKGGLQTLSRKARGLLGVPVQPEPEPQPEHEPEAVVQDLSNDVQMDDETVAPSDENDVELEASNLPTGKELLDMAGFDTTAAQELSDFEEGEDAQVPKPTEDPQPNGTE